MRYFYYLLFFVLAVSCQDENDQDTTFSTLSNNTGIGQNGVNWCNDSLIFDTETRVLRSHDFCGTLSDTIPHSCIESVSFDENTRILSIVDECGIDTTIIPKAEQSTVTFSNSTASFPANPIENSTHLVTDDGTETGDILEHYVFDLDSNTWVKLPLGSCEGTEMTRAALIALRNAGGLNTQCHYIITDPNANGNLDVQKILIHAVDENTLSGCYIKTSHDNTAWVGSYDIDLNDVEYVFDHLNRNKVSDNVAIELFPFGVATVTLNDVNTGGRLIYNGGTVRGNTIEGGSSVTVNAGSFNENEINTDANVISSGNTLGNIFSSKSNSTINSGDFIENEIKGDATITMSSTGDFDNNKIYSTANVSVTGTGNFDSSTMESDANLNISAGNATSLTLSEESNTIITGGALADSYVGQDANVTISSGSNYENIFGASTIFNQVGTGYIRYSTIEGTTTWTNGNTNLSNVKSYVSSINTTGSTGTISNSNFNRAYGVNMQNIATLTISDATIKDYSSISANNATRFYFYRGTIKDGSRILISAGSRIDASYTHLNSYSYLQSTGNGGFLRANYCNLSSLGYIRNLTTNSNYAERCEVGSNSSIRFDGNANNCRIYYSSASGGGSIYHTGNSNASYIYYGSVDGLGQIYTQGSVNARLYYNTANSRGYVRTLNVLGTHYIYYTNASASGYAQINNATAGRIYGCDVSSQSILEKRGATNVYYSSFQSYYYAYITRTTGTSSGLFGMGRRSYTVTNPATVAPYAVGASFQNF